MVLDWISRKLYWISEATGPQSSANPEEKYSVVELNLSLGQILKPKVIVKSRTSIKSIAVNPYQRYPEFRH